MKLSNLRVLRETEMHDALDTNPRYTEPQEEQRLKDSKKRVAEVREEEKREREAYGRS